MKKNKIFKIKNNLEGLVVLDLLIDNKSFYISAFNKKNKCKQLIILKSNFELKKAISKLLKNLRAALKVFKLEKWHSIKKIRVY